jgi:predicted metal-dependent hydrolase
MKVRTPDFDFSELPVHWAENTELVQMINALNLVPAYIEPFLIKVVRRAKPLLDPVADAQLIADLDVFNKQEAQHYKFHAAFNRRMREAGYPGMASIEAAYEADYERMLATKPLRFLLAYCEGFETMGSLAAEPMVDGDFFGEDLRPTESSPVAMWRWHLAEEFEHRTVIHRLYYRLYGRPRTFAWLYRLYGLYYCGRHLRGHIDRMTKYLRSVDHEHASLDPTQLAEAEARGKAAMRQMPSSGMSGMSGKMLNVLSPWYDPAKLPPPRDYEKVLATYT